MKVGLPELGAPQQLGHRRADHDLGRRLVQRLGEDRDLERRPPLAQPTERAQLVQKAPRDGVPGHHDARVEDDSERPARTAGDLRPSGVHLVGQPGRTPAISISKHPPLRRPDSASGHVDQSRFLEQRPQRRLREPGVVKVAVVLLGAVGDLSQLLETERAGDVLRDHRLHVGDDRDEVATGSEERDPVGQQGGAQRLEGEVLEHVGGVDLGQRALLEGEVAHVGHHVDPLEGPGVDVQVTGLADVSGPEVETDVAPHLVELLGVDHPRLGLGRRFGRPATVAKLVENLLADELDPARQSVHRLAHVALRGGHRNRVEHRRDGPVQGVDLCLHDVEAGRHLGQPLIDPPPSGGVEPAEDRGGDGPQRNLRDLPPAHGRPPPDAVSRSSRSSGSVPSPLHVPSDGEFIGAAISSRHRATPGIPDRTNAAR